nr:hypothetical protein [Tanacetum cinerariifolium]
MKKVDRGIMMMNHTQAEAIGILSNVLCQVGVTTLIAKFLILDILIDRDSPIVVEEDDVKPWVIFGRSFLRMTKAITDFGVGTITIYLNIDPFLEKTKGEEKTKDDCDRLLDCNIDDVPLLGEEGLLPFVCKMGKSSHNKKRAMENLNFFYQDVGTSSSAGCHLTQEEAAKGAIEIRMS